jgi:hypothetical protein
MFAPGYEARMRAESLATLDALRTGVGVSAKAGDSP